ncbi:MAG: hypothetical protein JWR10_2449 [Rubritepida sp.]|nr:hypothetical protein [Rubritepida sp.]
MAVLAERLAGEPTQRVRDTLRFGSKGSLAVQVHGAKRGVWHDHEAGVGGDPLGLIAHLLRIPMRDAYRWALEWLGETGGRGTTYVEDRAKHPESAAPSSTLDLARRIWREAIAPAGTPVETYLASRGLQLEPGPLRFHPACPRGSELLPCMVALMTHAVTGEPCGAHRTFLAVDGLGKAAGQSKMMAGSAGVIRLTRDEDVGGGLGIAEGIETALSVAQGFGWRPVWAATSAGAITKFPVLGGIEALTIFADPDGPGTQAAATCAERWNAEGREARIIAPPAGDWNDLHRSAG